MSDRFLGDSPPNVTAYSIDELEDMLEGLIEAINILQPNAAPQEYLELLRAVQAEILERSLLDS